MLKFEFEYLSRVNPDKQNVNPWNKDEKIYCKELATKYYSCADEMLRSGKVSSTTIKCLPWMKMAVYCYKLDEKYFLEVANKELLEDYYLDIYIQKQLKTKEVLKPKNRIYMESGNLKQNIGNLEGFISDVHRNLRDSKNLAETARAEVVAMENNVGLLTDDTPKAFFPQINEIFKDLQQEIRRQNDVNEFMLKQITELKKEDSVIKQKIVDSETKSRILEDAVGINYR